MPRRSPRFGFGGNYFSAEQFLEEHPRAATSRVGVVVLELELRRHHVDFAALDRIVGHRHRVIVYSHITTDEVILSALDIGAVTYLAKSERKEHLIDAIRAAGSDTPYVGPRMAGAMLNDSAVGRPNLAPREKEVLIAWFPDRKQRPRCAPTTDCAHYRPYASATGAREVRRSWSPRHHQGRAGGSRHSRRHRQCRRHVAAGRVRPER